MYNVVVQGVLRLASPTRPLAPTTGGHLSYRDTFAWSRGCPFTTGTTVGKMFPSSLLVRMPRLPGLMDVGITRVRSPRERGMIVICQQRHAINYNVDRRKAP